VLIIVFALADPLLNESKNSNYFALKSQVKPPMVAA
jgi:hypothetical protein